MTDRNGNLNENSRSGGLEHGRQPGEKRTSMKRRDILLEDEAFLDEPEDGYLDDDYLDDDYLDEDDLEDDYLEEDDRDKDWNESPEQPVSRKETRESRERNRDGKGTEKKDDYLDREMEERILREAELDMKAVHHDDYSDPEEEPEAEGWQEDERREPVSRRRSRARGSRGGEAGREETSERTARKENRIRQAESGEKERMERANGQTMKRRQAGAGTKKAALIAACTAGILVVAAGGVYAGLSQKYKTHFFPHTQINGIDASGKTAAEVQDLIAAGVNGYTLTIDERNDQKETIAGADIKLHAEFDGSLEKMVAAQNPFAWLGHVKQEEYTIGTMVAYDDAALESQIRNLSCLDPEQAVEPVNASISEYTAGQGYSIVPEQEGTAVEEEKLIAAVTDAIENLQDHLSLEEAEVYKEPTVLKDDAALAKQLEEMNKYANMRVTYKFGDSTEVLSGDQIHEWLIANADGTVSVDSGKVAEYVSEMAKAHNTSNKAKTLKTSYGSTIQVSGGTYGWKINQAAETEALASIIRSGESTTREPEYSQTAASHGANDYGNTYVEINLTGQHLFFYKEGKLVVESDFVSGNLAKGWGTPAGTYPLAYKQRNAVLKGENYRTPVDYWMPFNNGIGLHDAKWRSTFGGAIYKTSGSHGCINLPPSVAKTIFDNISAGTPIICYNLAGTEKSTTSGTAKPAETKPAETKPAETKAPETQAPAPTQAETQAPAPTPAPTAAPTQAETQAPAPTQAAPGGPSGDNGDAPAVGPGA